MNRFAREKKKHSLLVSGLLALAVVGSGSFLLSHAAQNLQETTSARQVESLRRTITRSAVQCYAVEGTYPESLDYLCKQYGITWDSTRYVVDYEILGSNLMPTITVFARN